MKRCEGCKLKDCERGCQLLAWLVIGFAVIAALAVVARVDELKHAPRWVSAMDG